MLQAIVLLGRIPALSNQEGVGLIAKDWAELIHVFVLSPISISSQPRWIRYMPIMPFQTLSYYLLLPPHCTCHKNLQTTKSWVLQFSMARRTQIHKRQIQFSLIKHSYKRSVLTGTFKDSVSKENTRVGFRTSIAFFPSAKSLAVKQVMTRGRY